MHAAPPPPARSTAASTAASAALAFDPRLIRKYDGRGPRYTSYPTADRFHDGFVPADYVDVLQRRSAAGSAQPLSLYVHLPFCNTVCYYCACNKIITRNRAHSSRYVAYVEREIARVGALVEGVPPVAQLHWGGGTPTFLAQEEMNVLMRSLRGTFRFAPDAEISIEVDPRKVDAETIAFIAELGFNRMSVGVQDFDAEVQRAVNRVQSEAETRSVIDTARAHGFASINVDLIYGLPRQSVAGFAATLDKVVAMAPDRIALYSYAHVPELFKTQRQISAAELPAPEVKLDILALAIAQLGAAGYVYVGMDHFARPQDELAIAQRERRLQRNFQGYSTRPDCDLLGFGITAIGKVQDAYIQNVKTLHEYYQRIDAGALPVLRGVALTRDDVLRRAAIQRLMCDFELDFGRFEAEHDVAFAEYFGAELEALRLLADDGIVTLGERSLAVTAAGRLLVRTVAMVFDRYLREARERARYSRVI